MINLASCQHHIIINTKAGLLVENDRIWVFSVRKWRVWLDDKESRKWIGTLRKWFEFKSFNWEERKQNKVTCLNLKLFKDIFIRIQHYHTPSFDPWREQHFLKTFNSHFSAFDCEAVRGRRKSLLLYFLFPFSRRNFSHFFPQYKVLRRFDP